MTITVVAFAVPHIQTAKITTLNARNPTLPNSQTGVMKGRCWTFTGSLFILFSRENRWPSGRRVIATRVARCVSHDSYFSMFAQMQLDRFLVDCIDVQLSICRCSGPASAGEGQARRLALRFGPRGQHGIQLLQRAVGQSVRARAAVSLGIRFLAVSQRGHAR